MSPSILFYISPQPALAPSDQPGIRLQHNIRQNFRFEVLPRWTLEHRIFRETEPVSASTSTSVAASHSRTNSVPGSQTSNAHGSQASLAGSSTTTATSTFNPNVKYLQCLTLSWFPRKTWVGISGGNDSQNQPPPVHGNSQVDSVANTVPSTAETNNRASQASVGNTVNGISSLSSETSKSPGTTLTSIPTTSLDEFASLLSIRLTPLWTPRGGTVLLREGTAIKVKDFIIRYGDLTSGSTGGSGSRGVVCEIIYTGNEVPEGSVAAVIQSVWGVIGQNINGWKMFDYSLRGQEIGGQAEEGAVRRWMDVLRIRDGR